MNRCHLWYSQLEAHELQPHFGELWGYWGVRSPQQVVDSTQSLFCLVQTEGLGLYVGVHDTEISRLVQYVFEQTPGNRDSVHHRVLLEKKV